MQSSLGKISDFFNSHVSKALDVGTGSGEILSVSAKNAERPCKSSGSKGANKHTEGSSRGNDNIDVGSI